jgi:general secretion pathway protein C
MHWTDVRQRVVSSRWQAWLPVATTYLLLLVFVYLLADLTWRSVGMLFPDEDVGTRTVVATESGNGSSGDGSAMAVVWKKFAIFGAESPSEGAANATRPAVRQVTPTEPVRLTLYGTVASDEPGMSLAVVAVKGGKAEIYRVGDELQRGVTLKSVDAWSIVVSAGGEDRVVQMIDASQLPDRPTPPLPRAASSDTSGAKERRINDREIVDKLREYRSALAANPLALMDKLRAYPVKRGGEPYGIRVRPGTDRRLLGEVGLRSGDILIAINGVPLRDVTNLPDVMAQLKTQTEFSVELERAGKRQELRVVVDETGGR